MRNTAFSAKSRTGVGESSLNSDIAILSHLYVTAINAGVVELNPVQKVRKLKVTQIKDRILSGDEIAAILDMPEGKDRLMILTALFTGMRLNEVLNLTWDDIDFGRGILHVFQSKTSKNLDIPLSDCLRTAL